MNAVVLEIEVKSHSQTVPEALHQSPFMPNADNTITVDGLVFLIRQCGSFQATRTDWTLLRHVCSS